MAFITQSPPDCGAFATAYYLWHRANGGMPVQPHGAYAEVGAIYDQIQFGPQLAAQLAPQLAALFPNVPLEKYSNPVNIMQYLSGNLQIAGAPNLPNPLPNPEFRYAPVAPVQNLVNAMQNAGAILPGMIPNPVAPPPLVNIPQANNRYLIAICLDRLGGLHYVLVINTAIANQQGGFITVINPWDGDETHLNLGQTNQFIAGTAIVAPHGLPDFGPAMQPRLQYLQAGIWLA